MARSRERGDRRRSDRALTFGGKPGRRSPGRTDAQRPGRLRRRRAAVTSVSLYLPEPTPPATFHWDARKTTYVGAGDQTGVTALKATRP